jgi:hypothetical protein
MRKIAVALACLGILTAGNALAAQNTAGGIIATGVLSQGGVNAPTGGSGINPAGQAAPVTAGYSALTAAECRGLGGKVVASTACSLNGGTESCVTVDSSGVVRRTCLSK